MKINVKATIHFNGQEYSSPDQLPPEAQLAYREATASGGMSLNERLDKIVLNGHELAGQRGSGHRIYEDIMRVVENNGQVTLPVSSEPRFTRRQIILGLALLVALATLAFAVLAKAIS